MTSGRTVSSPEALNAAQQFKPILDGLLQQIQALNKQAETLSNPQYWDGQLAGQFRSSWPSTNKALNQVVTDLKDLQTKIDRIINNIREAGGG